MKEPKAPKYFARAHIIYLLTICVVNVLDIFRITKSEETFMLINHAQVLSLLIILPVMFVATIVILLIYRKNKQRYNLQNLVTLALSLTFNLFTWFFTCCLFAPKF
ncbi:MAG: hypothetical protein II811_02940 [Spirochaetaceae bacterium]|nr:hypothetical protein [Spirochaetaceae bacterium]